MGKYDPWPYIDAITKLAAFATATYPLFKAAWEKLRVAWRKLKAPWAKLWHKRQ